MLLETVYTRILIWYITPFVLPDDKYNVHSNIKIPLLLIQSITDRFPLLDRQTMILPQLRMAMIFFT